MDILISRDALLKPLQAVSGVVEKKQTLPILSNVHLTVKDMQLCLTGTDLEMELLGFAPLHEVYQAGSITVSAKKLFDICRALPENTAIRLTLEKSHLVVKSSESSFRLNTLPADAFPRMELSNEGLVEFTLLQHQLKQLFSKTYFAMAQQDVRHFLNGALLEIGNGAIRCIAADGHRLALSSVMAPSIDAIQARAILPRKSVLELMRLLDTNDDSSLTIQFNEHRMSVTTPDFILTSKLITVPYPDYHRLIPKGDRVAYADRELVKQALVRASILSNEKFRGVSLQLDKNNLRISANNSDQERAEEALPLQYDGANIDTAFNVAYLLDVVSTLTSKMIRCIFSGPSDGLLIQPEGDDDTVYVVMPMRI